MSEVSMSKSNVIGTNELSFTSGKSVNLFYTRYFIRQCAKSVDLMSGHKIAMHLN